MKYNGVELVPITKIQAFEEPRDMLVWDEETDIPEIKIVLAIMTKAIGDYNVYNAFKNYKYCAEIPKTQKRDMNSLEVMEYLHKYQLSLNFGGKTLQYPLCISEFNRGLVVILNTMSESVGWMNYTLFNKANGTKTTKFGILKNGKVTEFKLPQIEVKDENNN